MNLQRNICCVTNLLFHFLQMLKINLYVVIAADFCCNY
jgi:hypothetical protein